MRRARSCHYIRSRIWERKYAHSLAVVSTYAQGLIIIIIIITSVIMGSVLLKALNALHKYPFTIMYIRIHHLEIKG